MDSIGSNEVPPKSMSRKPRQLRPPRKVVQRIETARISRLVRLIGGDLGKMAASGELADNPELAQASRGSLIAGVERLYHTMQSMPRGIEGHGVTLEVVKATNAVYKSAIAAINGAQGVNTNVVNIVLPTGAEARAILDRLNGVESSRIVDVEKDK